MLTANTFTLRALITGIALTIGSSAFAAILPISYSTTAMGTTGDGTITDITAPDLYLFGHSGNMTLTSSLSGTKVEFYDDYVFTIADSVVSSVSSTLNFGNVYAIDSLQARLYNKSGNSTLPVFGTPVGGEIDGASATYPGMFSANTVSVLNNVHLAAGTYVLEIHGTVTGLLGGGYAGVLNATPLPVPVPAAAWLMGSALLGLFGTRRRC